MTTTSWGLVARAQAGDTIAFGQLWTAYQPPVYRFIRSRVSDRGLAEDLTSEVFLRAWQSIGTVSDQGRDIGAWFITIARNKIKDHYKSPYRSTIVVPAEPIQSWDYGLPTTPGPEVAIPDQHGRAAVSAHLERYTRRLAPRQRVAVRMKFTDESSGEQMGNQLDCTAAASRGLHHRATNSMRDQLADDGISCAADFVTAALEARRAS